MTNLIVNSILVAVLLMAVFESVLMTSLAVSDFVVDLNFDGEVDIADVTIVATAFGSKAGDSGWNLIADVNGDGEIDIMDVTIVAINFGKTFVHGNLSFGDQWGTLDFHAVAVSWDTIVLSLTFNAIHNVPNWKLRVDVRKSGTAPLLDAGVLPDGLELVDGSTVWEGYNNVTQVNIRAKARAVKDGEWKVHGWAIRVEGTWNNYSALDGFGSGALRITVLNGTITSITKWEPAPPPNPTYPIGRIGGEFFDENGELFNGTLRVDLEEGSENLTIKVQNNDPQQTVFFDDTMYGLQIYKLVNGDWAIYKVLGEPGITSLEPGQEFMLTISLDLFEKGYYKIASTGWFEQNGQTAHMYSAHLFQYRYYE